jgi:hypothetical protein
MSLLSKSLFVAVMVAAGAEASVLAICFVGGH